LRIFEKCLHSNLWKPQALAKSPTLTIYIDLINENIKAELESLNNILISE